MNRNLKKVAKKIKDRLSVQNVKEFELYLEAKEGTNLEVKEGVRDVYENKMGLGFGLRILENHQMSFSYGSDFSDSAIDFVIDQCRQSLPFQNLDKNHTFAKTQQLPPGPQLADPSFSNIAYDEKLDFIFQMEKAAYKMDSKVTDVKYASLDDEMETVYLENSNGMQYQEDRTVFCASIGVQTGDRDGQEIAYEMDSQIVFKNLRGDEIAQSAAIHSMDLLDGQPIPNYKGPIILHREVVGELLDIWALSFMGDHVYKKNSYLEGKLGKQIYSKNINLIDDGLMENGMGSSTFDDEGSSKQSTTLIKDGIISGFLYDLYWGLRSGLKTTGNASREDVTAIPELSYSNFYIKSGTKSLDEMLKELDQGILVTDAIGMHNADESSGNFSVGIQGLVIKNGQKCQAIRSNVLTGNLHDVFSSVQSVGSDLKFYGCVGAPSLLIVEGEISGE